MALGAIGISTAPASAADKVHRGKDGCFSWSWEDGGVFTTTIYLKNNCKTTHKAEIIWTNGAESHVTLKAGQKGSDYSAAADGVKSVEDLG